MGTQALAGRSGNISNSFEVRTHSPNMSYGNGMNFMGQNNSPGANPFMLAANMLSNAFNGGMNRGSPQGMGMGPMGPTNMAASPQPPGNWRDMMNKNAAQQRMYQNQGGPHVRGGAGSYNMPMRGSMKQQQQQTQQRRGGQGQFKKANSPAVGKHDLRRQLTQRKAGGGATGISADAAKEANAKAKVVKANATAKKAAFKKKLTEVTKNEESTGDDIESKTDSAATVKKEVTVEGDDEKAGTNGVEKETIKVENNEEEKNKASPYYGIPTGLLFCPTCNWFADSPWKFEQHVKGRGHDKVLKFVAEQAVAMEGLLRGQCKLAEARRDAKRGTFIAKSHKCNMCQVRTQMAKFHVNSEEHKNLKKFLHPVCDGVQFQDRTEMEKHEVSPDYLKALAAKGVVDQAKHYTDLMDLQLDSLAERSAAWTKPPKESNKEYFEISRRIKGYTLPDFNESDPQPIGYAFLKTVSASHCKLCDKQLINKEELSDHMKTREHYDLFAADVANRREKVAASQEAKEAKKRSAAEAAEGANESAATTVKSEPKIKTEEEGNFKRPKKEEDEEEEEDVDIDGPGIEGPDLLGEDEVEADDAAAS